MTIEERLQEIDAKLGLLLQQATPSVESIQANIYLREQTDKLHQKLLERELTNQPETKEQ